MREGDDGRETNGGWIGPVPGMRVQGTGKSRGQCRLQLNGSARESVEVATQYKVRFEDATTTLNHGLNPKTSFC